MTFNENDPALYLNGIPLEKAVCCFMDNENLGSVYNHNDFNPRIYPNEKSLVVDGKIPDKLLIECTNPKETTSMNDSIMYKKIFYFFRVDPLHALIWVMVVSFANFSDYIKTELNRLGIILIEVGLTATNINLKTIIKRLYHTRLIGLIKRLKLRTKTDPNLAITTLTQYSLTNSSISSNPISSNSTYLHRTANTKLTEEDKTILEQLSKPIRPIWLDWLHYKLDMKGD